MQFFATTLWTVTKKGCKTDLKPSLVYQEIHSYIKVRRTSRYFFLSPPVMRRYASAYKAHARLWKLLDKNCGLVALGEWGGSVQG